MNYLDGLVINKCFMLSIYFEVEMLVYGFKNVDEARHKSPSKNTGHALFRRLNKKSVLECRLRLDLSND